MKLLSVIIPVYNVEPYLRRALDSVINQTYKALEIVCVDDGSTDGSGAILDEYAKKDSRVKVFHKQNGGVASARNVALRNASGEYITFLDSDDWIDSDMYYELVQNLENENADISICAYYKSWENSEIALTNIAIMDKQIEGSMQVTHLFFHRTVYPGVAAYLFNKIFKKTVLEGLQFQENLKIAEDVRFLADIVFSKKSVKITYMNTPMYHYYQRVDSAFHGEILDTREQILAVYKKLIIEVEGKENGDIVVPYLKRFYVYHASLLAEEAYNCQDKEKLCKYQKAMEEYQDNYYETSEGHVEWNKRIEDILSWRINDD